MSLGELGLTLGVACVVLGPKQYKQLLHVFLKIYKLYQLITARGSEVIQQAKLVLQLEENQQKAQQADEHYRQ